jgi:hypothetical protein
MGSVLSFAERNKAWRISSKALLPRSLQRRNSCCKELVLLSGELPWESLRFARNVLAANQAREFGMFVRPSQFVEDASESNQPALPIQPGTVYSAQGEMQKGGLR